MTGHHQKVRKTSAVRVNRYAALTFSLGAVLGIGAASAAPAMAESQPEPQPHTTSQVLHDDRFSFEGLLSGSPRDTHPHAPWLSHGEHRGMGVNRAEEKREFKALLKDLSKSAQAISRNFEQCAAAKTGMANATAKHFEDLLENLRSGTDHGANFRAFYGIHRKFLRSADITPDARTALMHGALDLSKIIGQIADLAHQATQQQGTPHLPHHRKPPQARPENMPNPNLKSELAGCVATRDVADPSIQKIAAWAVDKANRKQSLTGDAAYHLASVQSAESQVVAGAN